MRLGDISNPTFHSALAKLLAQDLPVKTSYKLKKLVDVCEPELKRYNEHRSSIINKYCEKNEDGTPKLNEKGEFSVNGENVGPAQQELIELSLIEFDCAYKVSIDELGSANLSAVDLTALSCIISD
jgi:hypothetical protein